MSAVLVRDIAELMGTDVHTVCNALQAFGCPPRSVNMEVSGEEVSALAKHLSTTSRMTRAEAEVLVGRLAHACKYQGLPDQRSAAEPILQALTAR